MATDGLSSSGIIFKGMLKFYTTFLHYVSTLQGSSGVGAAGKNGESAIELLSEHDPGEFVGVGHRAERKFLRDAFAERFRKPVGIATDEHDFARAAVAAFSEPAGEGFGVLRLARGVQEHGGGGAVGVQALQRGFGTADFVDFDRDRK